jgi:uncharacterized protein DUF6228
MASFGRPVVAGDLSGMRIPLTLSARGLAIETAVDLETWNDDPAHLVTFFETLAANWHGWTGAKEWSNDDWTVSMSATHDGIGLVSLTISARMLGGGETAGSWLLRMVVPIEPGSLASLAERMRSLIEGFE